MANNNDEFCKGFKVCMELFEGTLGYGMTSNEERLTDMRRLYDSYNEENE